MKQDKGWYTIQELAAHIEMSKKSVWVWISTGKLKSTRNGSRHRITESDWRECLSNFNATREK